MLADAFESALAEILVASSQQGSSVAQTLEAVPTARSSIYFDEEVPLLILLRLKQLLPDDAIGKLAQSVTINIDASVYEVTDAVDSESAGRKAGAQVVHSEKVNASCFKGAATQDDCAILVWSPKVFIPYVNTRTTACRISFSVTLSFESSVQDSTSRDAYILSEDETGEPNILASLCSDSALARHQPRLAASRLSTMTPITDAKSAHRRVKKHARRSFPCKSAISLRIKSTMLAGARAIVSLDIEATLGTDKTRSVEISDLNAIASEDGKVEALGQPVTPLCLCAREQLLLVFQISPSKLSRATSVPVEFSMVLRPQLGDVETYRGPQIRSRWATSIRVRPEETPIIERPKSQLPSAHSARPGDRLSKRFSAQSGTSPRPPGHPFEGIHLTLQAPTGCNLGETVTVTVTLANASSRQRALSISVPAATQGAKQLPMLPQERGRDMQLDRFALSQAITRTETALICLSPELAVGSLLPNETRTLNLQFVAMLTGMAALQSIQIIDMQTGQGVDVPSECNMMISAAS